MRIWLTKVLQGFVHAWNGLIWALRTQRNVQIHLAASLVVVAVGLGLELAVWKWCFLGVAIAMVWVAELINTALETLCDRVTKENDDSIRRVKDMAAAAVLMAAFLALFIAILVLLN